MSTASRDIANELAAENEREKIEERSRKIKVTPSKLPRLDWFETLGRVGPTVYLIEEESGLVVAEFCASQRGREDAAGIVLRNNAHDALVKALRFTDNGHGHYAGCVRTTPPHPSRPCRKSCEIARAALAAAQE